MVMFIFQQNYCSLHRTICLHLSVQLCFEQSTKCDGTCSVSFVLPSILHFSQRLYSFHWQLFFLVLITIEIVAIWTYILWYLDFKQVFFLHSEDRASWYIITIKASEMHCFSTLFGKELYMFQTDLLSIIRSLNTVFTAIGICHTSYIACLLARSGWTWPDLTSLADRQYN